MLTITPQDLATHTWCYVGDDILVMCLPYRVSASAIAQCEGKLLPQAIAGGVRKLTKWLRGKWSVVHGD